MGGAARLLFSLYLLFSSQSRQLWVCFPKQKCSLKNFYKFEKTNLFIHSQQYTCAFPIDSPRFTTWLTGMDGKNTFFVDDALSPTTPSKCRHSDWNRFRPTYWQTYTHPPQPQSPRAHCFGHSWPLCFTYQSLSAACWAPPLRSSFSNRWAKPSISLLQAAFVITPTHLWFARCPKSSKSACVACEWMVVFFTTHRKNSIFHVCYRLHLKVWFHEVRMPRSLCWSRIYLQTFDFCFLLNPTWIEWAQTKVFAVSNNFIFALEERSQYIPQKYALNLRQERSDVNVLSRVGCKGNIWWNHWCAEASDTWSETGPSLNDCSVFSCLQLVFCFMNYSDSRVTVLCVRVSAQNWQNASQREGAGTLTQLSGFCDG